MRALGVSVWRPVAPTPDYAAVGHVVTSGKSPTEADGGYPYGCLHKSFLAPASKTSDAHLLLWQPEWMSEGYGLCYSTTTSACTPTNAHTTYIIMVGGCT
jgi:hypothetical protein